MAGSSVKRTKQEEELTINYGKAMNAKDYEQALFYISELIQIKKHDPVYYLWLGDCYRVSAQVDNALDSYRKALELEEKYYTISDEFREDAERHIKGLELIQKATQAYKEKQYEETIHWIDDFTKIDPNWGDIYVLRGHCNECNGSRSNALLDYEKALTYELPPHLQEYVEERVKAESIVEPTKNVQLSTNKRFKKKTKNPALKDEIDKYSKFFNELNKIYQRIASSDDPRLSSFNKSILKFRALLSRLKSDTYIIGVDENGLYIVTEEEIVKRLKNNPDYKPTFTGSVRDEKTGKEVKFGLKLGSRFIRTYPLTISKIKEHRRKRNYYYNHQEKLLEYQRKYDKDHKPQTHFRNKFYYIVKGRGTSQTYNDEFTNTDELNRLHYLSKPPRRKKKRNKT